MRFLHALSALLAVSLFPGLCQGQVYCGYSHRCEPGRCNLPLNDRAATVSWDLSDLTRDVLDPLSLDYALTDVDGFNYFANVCGDCKANCNGRSGDAVRIASNTSIDDCTVLGTLLESWFLIEANNPRVGINIMFTHGDGQGCEGTLMRSVQMEFACDLVVATELYEAYAQVPGGCDYTLKFRSNLGCPNVTYDDLPTPPPPKDDSLSGGSIFLIIFFVVAFVYIVAGMVYNKQKYGKSGAELLPNYQFWTFTLPGLVKDGFRYTRDLITRRGGSSGGTKEEYEEVRPTTAGGGAAHTQSADL